MNIGESNYLIKDYVTL